MSDSLLHQLQIAADKALNSQSTQEGLKYLATAFSLFSKETQRLQNGYQKLQQRFDSVNNELTKTNIEINEKIQDLHAITSYLNNILKNISQGILFIDTDGVVTTYNQAAQKILKIEEQKILFKKFWNNFADEFFGFSMKNVLNLGQSQRINYITLAIDNEKKEIEISTTFVFDCPKAYQGIIVILRDITQIQKLQIEANRNDRLKELGEMAATVAHEIRNPLGAIRGYASLLYRDLENSQPLQEMASYIIDGTKALERLVNNVLHFTKPIQLSLASYDLSHLIKELLKSVKIDPSFSNNVKIDLHISQDSFITLIDKHYLKSALLNLIVNAFQAMEERGTLTISLLKNNEQFQIEVSDTGYGIEKKDLENIFSPFFTTKQYGNGLGLAETYKIIQAHFGTINVRSETTKGTTFSINLPFKR